MYLPTGAFLRSRFKDGYLDGTVYLRPYPKLAYMMKMDQGVLEGEVTIFDGTTNQMRVLEYKKGQFCKEIRVFKDSANKCKDLLLNSIFGIDTERLKQIQVLSEKSTTSKKQMIGSFLLGEKKWLHGIMVDGQPQGFGILHEIGRRIQIGWFEQGNLFGYGRVIWPNGMMIDGTVRNNQISDDVIVYNAKTHTWMKAEVKDTQIVNEGEWQEGFPIKQRIGSSRECRFLADRVFSDANISSIVYDEDEDQELLFHVVYGEITRPTMTNTLDFQLHAIEESTDRIRIQDSSSVKRSPSKNPKESAITESNPFKDDIQAVEMDSLAHNINSSIKKGHSSNHQYKIQESWSDSHRREISKLDVNSDDKQYGIEDLSSKFSEAKQINISNISSVKKQQNHLFTQETEESAPFDPLETSKITSKIDGFDNLDVLLLHRCLAFCDDENKTGVNRKTVSRKPKNASAYNNSDSEVVKNYMKNFLLGYIKKSRVKSSIQWMEGYNDSFLRQTPLTNYTQYQE